MHIHRKGLFKRSLPCSYHHNFDKRQTIPKISNFESKKRPQGRPGAPKTTSKLRENWSRALFRHVKSYNFGKPVIFVKRCRGFRPNFGVPLRSKNRPGTRPWQKIGSPENDFYRFLCFCSFSRFFGSILARFLRKKQWNLYVVFSVLLAFLQHGEGPNSCTGAVFWAVFTFFIFWENCKKTQKTRSKNVRPEKLLKMKPRGSQNSPKC